MEDRELLAELGLTEDDVKHAKQEGVIPKNQNARNRHGNWWKFTRRKNGQYKVPPAAEADNYANVVVVKKPGQLKKQIEGANPSQVQEIYNNHMHVMINLGGDRWIKGFLDIRYVMDKIVEMGKMEKKYFNTFYKKARNANK